MKRLFLIMLALCLMIPAALAETGVAYGVYSMPGEAMDSLIRASVTVEDGKITAVKFDEKLVPVAHGGAEGWAKIDGANAAGFVIDGQTWTINADETITNAENVDFVTYICTAEGGEWYFAQEKAELLNADGQAVATVEIGTKESTGHGVAFWPSELKFPGNIAALEAFVAKNGVDYALEDMRQGEGGEWFVADAATGATLAGTPNYLLLARQAIANVK